MNPLAVGVAAVAAFVASGAYYGALAARLARLSPAYAGERRSVATTAGFELVRNVVLALVIAGLAAGLGVTALGPALLLALALWVAFPAVLLTGSVFHERVPVALAGIHAGDWLLKVLIITLVVGIRA
ncbi:DUF1761 domain-containing protein [Pseudonocardia abyssalis]|uniref:DUF1761 domain-containing protein n=1 Tax=Pseudonocardia abyssalis TaxID=2792008 RepID=UPI001C49E553|nr:DUF1761 domain-containing protein [Pseudonocardia abyssalis]